MSGARVDLISGTGGQATAPTEDLNGNVVDSGPDSTLSVAFAQTAGPGSVSGLGSHAASSGVATDTVTSVCVMSVLMCACFVEIAPVPVRAALVDPMSLTVVHAEA